MSIKADKSSDILGKLHNGFSLREKIDEVYRHYTELALAESNGNLINAAKLLGEKNYQNVANWRDKYLK